MSAFGRLRLRPFVVYAIPKSSTNCVVTSVSCKPDIDHKGSLVFIIHNKSKSYWNNNKKKKENKGKMSNRNWKSIRNQPGSRKRKSNTRAV